VYSVAVTERISVTYCRWYTVRVPPQAAPASPQPPPQASSLTTAPAQPPAHRPHPPQGRAHVLAHRATTATAARAQEKNLRTTQTSKSEKETREGLEQVFLERARTSVGRRDLSLATTERFGRLLRWKDYVD